MKNSPKMIKIFTPSFADENNINAQNLTVKQIVRRLDPDYFQVTMFYKDNIADFIKNRGNTKFIKWFKHGNLIRFFFHHIFNKYDIYFYPRYTLLEKLFLIINRFRKNTKIITHLVHSVSEESKNNILLCKILKNSTVIVGNSPYVSKTLYENFNIKSKHIYNGIDKDHFFSAKNNLIKTYDVLYVGSLQERKRPELVIEVADKLRNYKFGIVGDGPLKNVLSTEIKNKNISNVELLGTLSQKDLGNIMRRSKIFFFPSINEGHPQSVGQAIACGLPVIAMEKIKVDYVINDENGFLLEDDDDIITIISLLINNKTLRNKMSKKSIAHSSNFNWDYSVSQWVDTFMEVVN